MGAQQPALEPAGHPGTAWQPVLPQLSVRVDDLASVTCAGQPHLPIPIVGAHDAARLPHRPRRRGQGCRRRAGDPQPTKATDLSADRQALFVGSEHRVQGVYTGCPTDAHRFGHGTAGAHPSYTQCTPLVHGAFGPREKLGIWGSGEGRQTMRLAGSWRGRAG